MNQIFEEAHKKDEFVFKQYIRDRIKSLISGGTPFRKDFTDLFIKYVATIKHPYFEIYQALGMYFEGKDAVVKPDLLLAEYFYNQALTLANEEQAKLITSHLESLHKKQDAARNTDKSIDFALDMLTLLVRKNIHEGSFWVNMICNQRPKTMRADLLKIYADLTRGGFVTDLSDMLQYTLNKMPHDYVPEQRATKSITEPLREAKADESTKSSLQAHNMFGASDKPSASVELGLGLTEEASPEPKLPPIVKIPLLRVQSS